MDKFITNSYNLTAPNIVDANRQGQITPEQEKSLGGMGTLMIEFIKGWVSLKKFFLIPFACLFGIFILAWLNVPGGIVLLLALTAFLVFLYLVVSRIVKFIAWRIALKKELNGGNIQHGTGELVFGRNGFEFQLDDQRLRLPFWDRGNIDPGIRYNVNYLPQSKTVLSARPLDPGSGRRVRQGLNELLAQANGFLLEALPDNRQGRLRIGQMKHFLSKSIYGSLFTFLPGGFIYYQYAIRGISLNFKDPHLGNILFLGIPGVIALYGLYRLVSVLVDVVAGWVKSVEGRGKLDTKVISSGEGGSEKKFFYLVEDMRFEVSSQAFRVFEENRNYRVYYTPATKTMINIEVI